MSKKLRSVALATAMALALTCGGNYCCGGKERTQLAPRNTHIAEALRNKRKNKNRAKSGRRKK